METRTIKRMTRKALQATRRLFAASHWGQGSFQRPTHTGSNKELFCMVGGVEVTIGARTAYAPIPDDVILALPKGTRFPLQKDVMTCIATAIVENPTFAKRITGRGLTQRVTPSEVKAFKDGEERYANAIIVAFNDNTRTTKDDVMTVLEAAQNYDVIHYTPNT
jgi:hypothetical protein